MNEQDTVRSARESDMDRQDDQDTVRYGKTLTGFTGCCFAALCGALCGKGLPRMHELKRICATGMAFICLFRKLNNQMHAMLASLKGNAEG